MVYKRVAKMSTLFYENCAFAEEGIMWHQLSRAAAILAFGLICLWFQSAALALPLLWVTAAQSQADPAPVVFHGGDGPDVIQGGPGEN